MALTELQEKFLELIFLPEYVDNEAQAALDAGYSPGTSVNQVIEGLKKEIIDKADTILARKVPKSLQSIVDVMSNPDQKGARVKLDASGMILDRVGISKKERLEIEHKVPNGIIILPAKKE